MKICVKVGYSEAHEADGNRRGHSVLEVFAITCDFPGVFFGKLRSPPLLTSEIMAELYTSVYNSFPEKRAMRSDDRRDL